MKSSIEQLTIDLSVVSLSVTVVDPLFDVDPLADVAPLSDDVVALDLTLSLEADDFELDIMIKK